MPKILFIINSLNRRGAEQQLYIFIRAIIKYFKIDVFTFSTEKEDYPQFFSIPGVQVFLCTFSGTYNIRKFWQLDRCIKKGAYDLIVTVGLGASLFWGRLSALRNKTRVVYSQLNTFENFNTLPRLKRCYFDILNQSLNRAIELLPSTKTYRLLPNSDKLCIKVKSQTGTYKVQTLYNGYHFNEFKRVADCLPSDHGVYGHCTDSSIPTIIQVGALDQNKNPMFTLRCIPILLEYVDPVHVVFVGEGQEKDKMRDWIDENHLNSSITFTGQLDRMDCLYMIRKADVLVLTSHSESFPNVLVEAHALGIPVVTLNVGAAPEIVIDGKTGYVVNDKNPKVFADRIAGLLLNRAMKREMGLAARDWVLHEFSMDKKVDQFVHMVRNDLWATYLA